MTRIERPARVVAEVPEPAVPEMATLQSPDHVSAAEVTCSEVSRTHSAEVSAAQATEVPPAATKMTSATPRMTAAAATGGRIGREGGASQRCGQNRNRDSLHHGFLRMLHGSCSFLR